jgi:hypothetical protein
LPRITRAISKVQLFAGADASLSGNGINKPLTFRKIDAKAPSIASWPGLYLGSAATF